MPLFRPYEHRRSGKRDGSAALSEKLVPAPSHEVATSPSTPSPIEPSSKKSGSTSSGSKEPSSDRAATSNGSATDTRSGQRARLQPKAEKKDRPTRTRAEAERARREQLHPTLTPKEAKARNRELRFQARQDALKKQESTPERELLRDYIDSRWTVSEFTIPVFVLLWAISLAFVANTRAQNILSLIMVSGLLLSFLNMWWVWRGFKREAEARLKRPNFRGLLMYGVNRMIFIRRFRRPPPRIPRGGEY